MHVGGWGRMGGSGGERPWVLAVDVDESQRWLVRGPRCAKFRWFPLGDEAAEREREEEEM
jgi:hypothetical protein